MPVSFIEAVKNDDGARQATSLFSETFGEYCRMRLQDNGGVWASPGRVNIIGEHTDYNEGLCLPIALPHRTFVALHPRRDTKVRVVSSVNPMSIEQADLDHLHAGDVKGWAAYAIGVAWALRKAGYLKVRGFDAAFVSCVPLGSGLSSSAAMTCSIALALSDAFDLGLSDSDVGRVQLIHAAIMAENEMAGASTGGLDQNASLRCVEGNALLLDCKKDLTPLQSVSQQPFDLAANNLELLVVDTCAPHQLNDGQYAARRMMCQEAAQALNVSSLRAVADSISNSEDSQQTLQDTLNRVQKLGGETMMRRVRHVVTEINRVREFVEAFHKTDITLAGELMNQSHNSLRDDYEVTVPELDTAVDVARNEGAYGARMTGGGFGGSIIALVDTNRAKPIAQAIADEFAKRGFAAPRALSAVPSSSGEQIL